MFFVRRFAIDIGRKSVGNHFRLYCNAAKKINQQNTSAGINQTFSNENKHTKHNENQNSHETSNSERVANKQQQEQEQLEDRDEEQKQKQEQEQNNNDKPQDQDLMIRGQFNKVTQKNKESFLQMVHLFVERDKHRRHHVEFIYVALKHMKEFGVERDLDVYKAVLDIMPKGKMVARNMFQAEFMHYPKHQDCAIFLLDQMEYNAIMPDIEVRDMIQNIFGNRSHPMYKVGRMLYWMPKFKHLSPWLLPDPIPEDSLELAKLAVRQMCTVDVESVVRVLDTDHVENSLDKTWIVSGQSPEQVNLLAKHSASSPLKIEGPFAIWLRNRSINYFTLVGDAEPDENFEAEEDEDDVRNIPLPKFLKFMSTKEEMTVKKPKRSIHQQDDGTIYAICATGTSTKDSLLSWIRLLETNGNANLAHIPVLFKFSKPIDDRALVVTNNNQNNETK